MGVIHFYSLVSFSVTKTSLVHAILPSIRLKHTAFRKTQWAARMSYLPERERKKKSDIKNKTTMKINNKVCLGEVRKEGKIVDDLKVKEKKGKKTVEQNHSKEIKEKVERKILVYVLEMLEKGKENSGIIKEHKKRGKRREREKTQKKIMKRGEGKYWCLRNVEKR